MVGFSAPTLALWLSHLEVAHPVVVDLGLARVGHVRDQLGLAPHFPIITIGGTNGKGSVCAMLSSILQAAGYRVGTYTSPHLLEFNERIRLNMQPADDAALLASFARVEAARGDTSLSYFEFTTLAAMDLFCQQSVDVAVMEVGLGGRLDAVNVFDPDVAAVVSIGLDHQNYLGDTREAIAFEKAAIFRRGKPAFCADSEPPQTLLDHAATVGADLHLLGRDYGYAKEGEGGQWQWWSGSSRRHALPMPALRGEYQIGNAALVLALLEALQSRLPVSQAEIKQGLLAVEWPARFQVLPGRPTTVLDVAHNPHAARVLRAGLDNMGFFPKTHAVLGMMADKDIAGVVRLLADRVDYWHVAAPDLPRAATAASLQQIVSIEAPQAPCQSYGSVAEAWRSACKMACDSDRILIFGSFYTVAEMLSARGRGI